MFILVLIVVAFTIMYAISAISIIVLDNIIFKNKDFVLSILIKISDLLFVSTIISSLLYFAMRLIN